MRTAQRGSIPIQGSLPIECHQGLVELARCRSDLFSASSISRRARNTLKPVSVDLLDSGTGGQWLRMLTAAVAVGTIVRLRPGERISEI